jgi:DNA-binding response OmpR family regulator
MKPRAKVLIVEDNSDVRRLYAIGLNQRGFEVKLAADGAQAMERISTEKPDVILLDWLMPLMDGGQVLDKLSGEGLADVPIIVISGQPAPEGAALDPRIRCWLTKPTTIDEIVAEISRPLGDRHAATC